MPSITKLPPRANSIEFTDEYVGEVASAVQSLGRGQAVTLDDDGTYETENKARSRAKVMRTLLAEQYGVFTRTHASGDDKTGWYPVLSINVTATANGGFGAADAE